MTLKFNLDSPRLVRIREAIPVPDELLLLFESGVYVLETLAVSVKRGSKVEKFTTHGEAVDISSLCRTAGSLDIEVSLFSHGEEVKKWRLEPLILREGTHGFEAIPEIEAMRSELYRLKTALSELVALEKNNENI